jgi:hypothetical protein
MKTQTFRGDLIDCTAHAASSPEQLGRLAERRSLPAYKINPELIVALARTWWRAVLSPLMRRMVKIGAGNSGGVAERPIAPVLKTGNAERRSRVQIPPPPLRFLNNNHCRRRRDVLYGEVPLYRG